MFWFMILNVFLVETQATQSYLRIKNIGTEFYPVDESILLVETSLESTRERCINRCHGSVLCRIFDYDSVSKRCRLFEGDPNTTGEIDLSDSITSVAGHIELLPAFFVNYGRTCDACMNDRHLRCVNTSCTCPEHTYWTGTVCASQKLYGASCLAEHHCRIDLNLTCLQFFQCGPLSLHTGVTIFGDPNGNPGNSTTSLNQPWGLTVTPNGSLLIADPNNNRVVIVDETSNISSTIISTGPSSSPSKAMYDPNMTTLYVLAAGNGRLLSFVNGSSSWTVIFGTTSGSGLNQLWQPHSFAMDSRKFFYIADMMNHRILKFPLGASVGTVVAGVTSLPGSNLDQLNYPTDIALDEIQEFMYVADRNNHRILRFKFNDTMGTVVAGGNGPGIARNQLMNPLGIYLFNRTNALYIVDQGNNRLQRWYLGDSQGVTIAGNPNGTAGTTPWTLRNPNNVLVTEDGTRLFISDRLNHRIQMFKLI